MSKQEKINNWVEETINSFDGAKQALAKPFLYTRLNAKMQHKNSNMWDNVFAFISKPAVAIACIALIVGLNGYVLYNNNQSSNTTDDTYAINDEYNTSTIAINDIETIEP